MQMKIMPKSDLEKSLPLLEANLLFQDFKKFLKTHFGKDVSFLEHDGIQFDDEDLNDKIELHFLNDSKNFVTLSFGVQQNDASPFIKYQFVSEENGQIVIKRGEYKQKTNEFEAHVLEVVDGDLEEGWSIIDQRIKSGLLEDLKKDEAVVNESIKAQGIFDFCLAGGYQYCGKGCGDCSGCSGGGSIKNKVDGCCYVHDYCYKNNSTNRCSACDWDLVNCVQNDINYKTGPIAADSITFFFSSKCGYVF